MNKIYLSKSKYCSCVQCEKILWLDKYKPGNKSAESNESILEKGRQVGEFAKGLFGDYEDVPFDDNHQPRLQRRSKIYDNRQFHVRSAFCCHIFFHPYRKPPR